jgi:hypothetical protein
MDSFIHQEVVIVEQGICLRRSSIFVALFKVTMLVGDAMNLERLKLWLLAKNTETLKFCHHRNR